MVTSTRVSYGPGEATRFSSQEEDLLLRSTKKVKDQEEGVMKEPLSYKDRLLTPIGENKDTELMIGDV